MADRLKQLDALASAIPGINQKAAQQAEAARQIQMQRQVAAAPAGVPATRVAQAAAPGQALAAGQTQLAAAQQTQQQLGQVAEQGLASERTADASALAGKSIAQREQLAGAQQRQGLALTREELAARKQISKDDIASAQRVQKYGLDQDNRLSVLSTKQASDLSRIGRDVKQKIFDSRLQFEKDENGRKFSNERQLADYTAANARTEQQFRERSQTVAQAAERKIQLMKVAHDAVVRKLTQDHQMSEGRLQFEHQKELQSIRDKLAEQIRKEEAAAKNRAAMWQAGGTIVGAAAGSMAGPAGAMVGASVGGALGTTLGGLAGG